MGCVNLNASDWFNYLNSLRERNDQDILSERYIGCLRFYLLKITSFIVRNYVLPETPAREIFINL